MIRQYELVEKVKKYDPQVNEALLNRAYVFSMKAHGSQKRASGDPYFSHPLEVAGILTDMRLDGDTIATALLHDTVEDTLATLDEIRDLFGSEIAAMVDGVTKLSRLEIQTESERQAENFRKFLLALSNDIRVLLVKLADRLHNMRTLYHIGKPEKRRRIALETMEIYAPLAERIGIRAMKDELEDLAFREINPEAYASVTQRLEYLREKAPNLPNNASRQLRALLRKKDIKAQISWREKTPFSIWKKMERDHIGFEELSDVVAFRVIVDSVGECYKTLGIIHQKWPMVPGQFDDYISTPKRNGYRSLHTTVIGPRKRRIEIQIRTHDMHEVAEKGVAAHWGYKLGDISPRDKGKYRWVRELLEILEQSSNPEEFLEHTKFEMFQDQVFCFTPKGELISLPRGSTPVDFAYAVHTAIGDSCVGAKVNGKVVPLRHQLQNGDQVEIVRSKAQTPSPRWESFVVTGRARSFIRRHIRKQERAEFLKLGRTILQNAFKGEGLEFDEPTIRESLETLGLSSLNSLYFKLGKGEISHRKAMEAIFPGMKFKYDPGAEPANLRGKDDTDGGIPIKGLTAGVAVHLAECCHPMPGDRIVGIRESGKGVMIHTSDCEALNAYAEEPDKWLDLSWKDEKGAQGQDIYTGRLKLTMTNKAGVLADIAAMVAKQGGNISNIKIAHRDVEFFTMLVDVEVKNLDHLLSVIAALRTLSVISTAERLKT